ncbi:MAG: LAGLIDADG family homing endonuclease [archaeon]
MGVQEIAIAVLSEEKVDRFRKFVEKYYYENLLNNVKKGIRSLQIDFSSLAKFDLELSEQIIENFDETILSAEEAIKQLDIPEAQYPLRVRVVGLPKSDYIKIRDIRARHLGRLISTDGIIRQSSDIRPKITLATFECSACGARILVEQNESKFREPVKCSCGRMGKFKLFDKKMVDIQRLVIEESPEALEGGEQPKRIAAFLQEDLLDPKLEKKRYPGNKIKIAGVIKEVPVPLKTGGQSTTYDLLIDVNSLETVEEEFGEIEISAEDEKIIRELAAKPNIYEKLVATIAPSIYGYDNIKKAIVMQLFGGVRKRREDGTNIRGDIHIFLIGDPGSGKCVSGDTMIVLSDGTVTKIREFVNLNKNTETTKTGYITKTAFYTPSANLSGKLHNAKISLVWQRKAPKKLLRIKTTSGSEITVTKNHPFFTTNNGLVFSIPAEMLTVKTFIAAPRQLYVATTPQELPQNIKRSRARNRIVLNIPKYCDTDVARFLAYVISESWISKRGNMLSFTNQDENLLKDFSNILKQKFNANFTIRMSHAGKSAKECYSCSSELTNLVAAIEPKLLEKSAGKAIPQIIFKSPNSVVAEFLRTYSDCEGFVDRNKRSIEIASASKELVYGLKTLLLRFGILSRIYSGLKYAANTRKKIRRCYWRLVICGEQLKAFKAHIGFSADYKKELLDFWLASQIPYNTNVDVVPNISYLLKELRKSCKKSQSNFNIPRSSYQHYERGDRWPSRHQLLRLLQSCEPENPYVQILTQLATADIFWDRVKAIEEIDSEEECVYDLQVDGTHNYVANTLLVHNSQLLRYVSTIAPKARYTAGKGSTAAGMTATVVRDEFLRGWALEAGVLVLCNKGIACLDEMDKMTQEDTSAMHEALEQQTITIAKANIHATLIAETSVLAAANPKFGRFDPYEPIPKQINLPPTLLNRFDLLFTIKDVPNPEKDEKIASHILRLAQEPESLKADIDTKLLRKYIAFAHQRCIPKLTTGALEEIKDFYIKLRTSAAAEEGEVKPIPISARQLEALVRLSEASAKIRLSDKVTKKDAQMAIELLKSSMEEVAMDMETGKFDIDRITTGITASTRSQISIIRRIIDALTERVGKSIPTQDIMKEAEGEGIPRIKAEDIINQLVKGGEIYEPKPGLVSKVTY